MTYGPIFTVKDLGQTEFLLIEKDGRRTGPHSTAVLKEMFIDGSIDGSCKVHVKKAMGWKNISDVFDITGWGLPEPNESVLHEDFDADEEEPSDATSEAVQVDTKVAPAPQTESNPRIRRGIGRTGYGVFTVVGLLILIAFFDRITSGPSVTLSILIVGFYVIPLIAMTAERYVNIGENPAWCLTLLVPLINLITLGKSLSCQEGYASTGELDSSGRMIFGAYLVFLALFAVGLALVVYGKKFS